MARYSHVFEIIFSVPSDRSDAVDVTPDDLWRALRSRLQVSHDEIDGVAFLCAEDTFELEEGSQHVQT